MEKRVIGCYFPLGAKNSSLRRWHLNRKLNRVRLREKPSGEAATVAEVETPRATVGALVDAESSGQREELSSKEIYSVRKNIEKYCSTSSIYLNFLIEHLLQISEGTAVGRLLHANHRR